MNAINYTFSPGDADFTIVESLNKLLILAPRQGLDKYNGEYVIDPQGRWSPTKKNGEKTPGVTLCSSFGVFYNTQVDHWLGNELPTPIHVAWSITASRSRIEKLTPDAVQAFEDSLPPGQLKMDIVPDQNIVGMSQQLVVIVIDLHDPEDNGKRMLKMGAINNKSLGEPLTYAGVPLAINVYAGCFKETRAFR